MADSGVYNDPTSFPYIERAVLIENIKLPLLNKKSKLTRRFFYQVSRLIGIDNRWNDEFIDTNYTDETGKTVKWEDKEYKLAYNEIKNIEAKFYIPLLMTTFKNDRTELQENKKAASKAGFVGQIEADIYIQTNYVFLTIPKYIVLQFLDLKNETPGVKDPIIPKGTEFLVACVGGNMDVEHMRIIGLYTLTYKKKDFPELKDDYYGGNNVK